MLEVIIDGEVGEPPPQPTANKVHARPSTRALRIGSSGTVDENWGPPDEEQDPRPDTPSEENAVTRTKIEGLRMRVVPGVQ